MADNKERLDFLEHILKYMYIDIPAQTCTTSDAVVIFYCINYQGNTYRLPHRMFCSAVMEKAEKLAELIISEARNEATVC